MQPIKQSLKKVTGDIGTDNETNRHKWIEATLKKIPPGLRILDAGAGSQPFRRFCSHLEYVSQDFGKYDGKGNAVGLQTTDFDYGKTDIISDIIGIPQPDQSFDAVMCTEVLEHLPTPDLAIKEFARLLKGGGHLILTAPFCSLTHFAPFHYTTGFSRYYYDYHLEKHGFEIIEIQENGSFFDYLAQEIRRLNTVASKYASSELSYLERLSLLLILLTLRRLRARDWGSKELLCYGYHVYARRIRSKVA
jgi:SAM-dependent methyltransferase